MTKACPSGLSLTLRKKSWRPRRPPRRCSGGFSVSARMMTISQVARQADTRRSQHERERKHVLTVALRGGAWLSCCCCSGDVCTGWVGQVNTLHGWVELVASGFMVRHSHSHVFIFCRSSSSTLLSSRSHARTTAHTSMHLSVRVWMCMCVCARTRVCGYVRLSFFRSVTQNGRS